MSTELVPVEPPRPVVGHSLKEVQALGSIFKASGYFKDIRDEAQAVTKILYGREVGFTPIISIMGIHIIEGKPALSSNLIATLIRRSGKYDYRVLTHTAEVCEIEFREGAPGAKWKDRDFLGKTEFTMKDAQQAGVVRQGSSWTKYPKAMLFARAISAGMREHCPDVSACPLYVPEELGADVNEEGEVVDVKPAPMPERSNEPLSFKKPESAAGNSSQGEDRGPVPKPEAAEISTVEALPTPAETPLQAPVSAPAVEYITAGQAKNLHSDFRKEVKKWSPGFYLKADDYFYQFLTDQGLLNEDRQPSAGVIPAGRWFPVKEAALKYARGLGK